MKTLVWLDDIRDPFAELEHPEMDSWLTFSPISQPFETVWLKTYMEFVTYVKMFGLPDGICFDHDLSDFQAMKSGYPDMMEDVELPKTEKTGMDCAKFLVEYCLDEKLSLPLYNIQSGNPVGAENIRSLLENFKKHNENQ